jgi:hypothetical protein
MVIIRSFLQQHALEASEGPELHLGDALSERGIVHIIFSGTFCFS